MIKNRIYISSAQTGLIKYAPIFILPIWIVTEVFSKNFGGATIPTAILLVNVVVNFFVVEASADNEAIYIKQWLKEKRYLLSKLDKVGELKEGVTRVTLLDKNDGKMHFLILNIRDSFVAQNSANVYELLLKLKLNYLNNQKAK